MKYFLHLTLWTALMFGYGCGKPVPVDTANWSKAEVVSQSSDSLASSFSLYKWNGSLLALGGDAGTPMVLFLRKDEKTWKTMPTANPLQIPLDCNPTANEFVVTRGMVQGDRMEMSFITASLTEAGSFTAIENHFLNVDKATLFGKTNQNVTISRAKTRFSRLFAGGTIQGPQIYVPYCMEGDTVHGKGVIASEGPFDNGVFCSSDSGNTWRIEHISNFDSLLPIVCRTKGFYYYFAGNSDRHELWYSRKTEGEESWSSPEVVVKSVGPPGVQLTYRALAEGDTVHVCWLDGRHEKTRPYAVDPTGRYNCENYEVACCHRKDPDSNWSKDVILSAGLLYAYSPSISVEGDKVVVAWAGVKNDKDGRNEWNPSDIYYVTSKDGGKTWTKPMQVTDGFTAGITSGRPQAALYHNVIHLFYIQGKLNYREVSAGMAKLNQPAWPIYYQQRPFPD